MKLTRDFWTAIGCWAALAVVAAFFAAVAIAASAADASGPRIKHLATGSGDYGNIWTFVVEPVPGVRLACVEATSSGGLWCARREAGETW